MANEETVNEARQDEIRKTVQNLRKNLDKKGFKTPEKMLVGAYLLGYELVEAEIASEESHPRDTLLAGLEMLNHALFDVEDELLPEEEVAAAEAAAGMGS